MTDRVEAVYKHRCGKRWWGGQKPPPYCFKCYEKSPAESWEKVEVIPREAVEGLVKAAREFYARASTENGERLRAALASLDPTGGER